MAEKRICNRLPPGFIQIFDTFTKFDKIGTGPK